MFYISSLVGWTIFCLLVTFSFWKIIFKLLLSFLSEELSSFQFSIQNLFWDTWSNRRPQAKSWRKLYKILSLGIKSGGLTDRSPFCADQHYWVKRINKNINIPFLTFKNIRVKGMASRCWAGLGEVVWELMLKGFCQLTKENAWNRLIRLDHPHCIHSYTCL